MATCKHCDQDAGDGELCATCRKVLGLTDGAGVRPPLPCQRCNHPELIRSYAREVIDPGNEHYPANVVPMAVTMEVVTRRSWTGKAKGANTTGRPTMIGVLEMYTCRKCGLTEWYCRDPQSVPIGEDYGTELVTVATDTPYR